MDQIFERYPSIFGEKSEEDVEEDKKSDSENEDSQGIDSNKANSNAFVWIELIDLVSETERISWKEVNELSIIEFCNVISYAIYKNKKREQAINAYKRNN